MARFMRSRHQRGVRGSREEGLAPMRHRDTNASRFPEHGTVVTALLCVLPMLAPIAAADPAPPTAKSGWSEVITVNKPHGEVDVLEGAFNEVVAAGMNSRAAAELLKHVGAYIDSEITERGSAVVSLGMIVDAVEASQSRNWSQEDATRLVIALQRDLNERHVDEIDRLQALIGRVNHGTRPDQILGNDETLKVAPVH